MKWARRLAIAAAAAVTLGVIVRLLLDPLATRQTRDALGKLDGFEGDFARVHVTVLPPGYDIDRLKIWKASESPRHDPLFFAERIRARMRGAQLLHGRLVADLRIEEPKIVILHEAEPAREVAPEEKAKAPDLAPQLADALPFRLARLEVVRGEILFRDGAETRHAELWVHDLDLAAENVATRHALAGGRPATVNGRGELGDSGTLTFHVTADPFARPLAFAGRAAVEGWQTRELYAFFEPKAGIQLPKGTIDVFSEFVSRRGLITGGVKPVLKNVEVRPVSAGAWNRLRAWLGDEAVELASDRVPGRNPVATTVPINGGLTNPDIQLWPAVLGVVRNAFVEGLVAGFSGPPKAQPANGHSR